jgi:hypothetical protein
VLVVVEELPAELGDPDRRERQQGGLAAGELRVDLRGDLLGLRAAAGDLPAFGPAGVLEARRG